MASREPPQCKAVSLNPQPCSRLTASRHHRRSHLLKPVYLSLHQLLCCHGHGNQVTVRNPRPAIRQHHATVSQPKSWRLPRKTAQAPSAAQAHPLTPTVRLCLRTPPRLSTPAPTGSDSSSSLASVYSPRACVRNSASGPRSAHLYAMDALGPSGSRSR